MTSKPPSTDTDGVENINWTQLNLEELQDAYWSHVAPALSSDGYDPDEDRPTHDWLHENGFSSVIYTLSEYHDLTFSEFWGDVLDLSEEEDDRFDWGIDHEETIKLLEAYLESVKTRGELSESTVQNHRYWLKIYVSAYKDVNGTGNLLQPIKKDSDVEPYEATDACWNTFDRLQADLGSKQSHKRVYKTVDSWYAHLVRRKRVAFNPASGLDEEYNWTRDASDNPRLAATHVRSLFGSTETTEEQLLVVALAAWGLRSGEVAELHQDQMIREDEETPYLEFSERKNGPGEVSVLYGMSVFEERVIELSERDDWNGYLFPSSGSESGHVVRQTILNWFDRLADRAGLPPEIDGEKPVPQMARRYWYDAYSSVLEQVLEGLEPIAEEQGSEDAGVVMQDYLTEERNRKLRREQMRKRLAAAFSDSEMENPTL